jgi:hypothetical protein
VQNGTASKKPRTGLCFQGQSPGSRKTSPIPKAAQWPTVDPYCLQPIDDDDGHFLENKLICCFNFDFRVSLGSQDLKILSF